MNFYLHTEHQPDRSTNKKSNPQISKNKTAYQLMKTNRKSRDGTRYEMSCNDCGMCSKCHGLYDEDYLGREEE